MMKVPINRYSHGRQPPPDKVTAERSEDHLVPGGVRGGGNPHPRDCSSCCALCSCLEPHPEVHSRGDAGEHDKRYSPMQKSQCNLNYSARTARIDGALNR